MADSLAPKMLIGPYWIHSVAVDSISAQTGLEIMPVAALQFTAEVEHQGGFSGTLVFGITLAEAKLLFQKLSVNLAG